MDIKIKLEGGSIPIKKTDGAACYDCFACLKKKRIILWGFQTKVISLGFRTEFDEGYYVEVRGRSGNSLKNIQTFIGTVDSDYRGIIGAITHNASIFPKIIRDGDRIAQIMVKPVIESTFIPVNVLGESERGEGGFGSTGR